MFDAVRNNKKIVQVFLVLIALPFAFFGVESYVSNTGVDDEIAHVGEVAVSQKEFQQTLRQQQERLRSQLGQVDPKMLDNPAIRKAVLDDLINQRLLALEAGKQRLFASDDAVRRAVSSIEAFQQEGKFSNERYEAVLRAQGMNPAAFEAQMRQDLTLQQLVGTIGGSAVVSRTVADRVLALQTESREVQEIRLPLTAYLNKVKLDEGAAKKFYDDNARKFELPEQARAEYVVLSQEVLDVKVSDEEIKAWYDGHKDRYQQAEERRASHILVSSEKLGKDKARERAEALLKDVQAKPAAFAELAKKNSDDPGSAAQGGDLGFFGRGMMVKPFEEATFALKEGQISGVVESDFGFHIIRLESVRAAKEKPLAEVRDEIAAELKNTAAARKFAESAEAFSNLVYEQADSLKPAAEQFKLNIQKTDWIGRQGAGASGVMANPKLLSALFGDDSIKNKRNTEAVEVGQNTLVAARIVDYKAAAQQPFETVRASIEDLLKHQEAQKLAVADGEARLTALKGGDDKLVWGETRVVSRIDPRQVPNQAVQPLFRLDTSKVPGYAGVELPGTGYALYRLSKVDAGKALDDVRRQGLLGQINNLSAQDDVRTYLDGLRKRYKVTINEKLLASGDK